MGDFDESIFPGLSVIHADSFDTHWDDKPRKRRWNKTIPVSMDQDMYDAIQDLIANKSLPFEGHAGDFGRHAFAVVIDSLRAYLSSDTRTLWSILQSTQRRLTAERYVVTAEEQVTDAAELLASWTGVSEWGAILNDLEFALESLTELPQAAWRRRVANEWLTSPVLSQLQMVWQVDMANEAPEVWGRVLAIQQEMREIAGA